MSNPYEHLACSAFWRSAVADKNPLSIDNLWTSKFSITKQDNFVTAGSCFAQHIGRSLARANYTWFDAEPAPLKMSEADKRTYNYGVFSFRTGNIYTAALLRQWVEWATGASEQSREVWLKDGRHYDPMRPAVEPNGFASERELFATRDVTLKAIVTALKKADVFVFTLGLTEAWLNTNGDIYAMCPGTIAGDFEPNRHHFYNFRYPEIIRDLRYVFDIVKSLNPGLRFLLTVSPVPLTATASSQHVLVASMQSKSTLRAVAGDLALESAEIDYFPSYDIISSFPFRAIFFEPNLRSVSQQGVDFVMRSFFSGINTGLVAESSSEQHIEGPKTSLTQTHSTGESSIDNLICEEVMLDAFRKALP